LLAGRFFGSIEFFITTLQHGLPHSFSSTGEGMGSSTGRKWRMVLHRSSSVLELECSKSCWSLPPDRRRAVVCPSRLQVCADTAADAECDLGRTQGHVGGKTLNGCERKRMICLLLLLLLLFIYTCFFGGNFTFHWMNVSLSFPLFMNVCVFFVLRFLFSF
jgi:hypothetical protein